MLLPTSPAMLAAAGGVATQLFLSPIQEVPTVKFVVAIGISELVLLASLIIKSSSVFLPLLQINVSFFGALITSCIIYRLYFHPLRHFPGRKIAAVSKIYEGFLNSQGRNSLMVREWHREMGDFVRIGPNEIAINNVEVLPLFQRQKYNSRGPFYEFYKTVGNEPYLVTCRDNALHKKWRGIWDKGFMNVALKAYNPRVEQHVDTLVSVMEKAKGKRVNCTQLTGNFTFDIMADLGFGMDHGMQVGKGDPTYIEFLHGFTHVFAITATFRNVMDLFPFLPVGKDILEFRAKGKKMLDDRIAMGKTRDDVFTHLLGEDTASGTKFTYAQLAVNAQLLIIAGSDTTSAVLACIFRELAIHKDIQQKLYEELREAVKAEAPYPLNCENTKGLSYLQAVVDEGLRLWNAVPSGAQVLVGPQGTTIAGQFLPPHTIVRTHHLSMMTDERYFSQAERFWPERWLGEKEGVKDIRAFIPFSYGAHVCIGKQLAINELRLAVAKVVEKFEVQLDEAYDDAKFHHEWRDYHTTTLGELPMRFISRDG